jgi:6-phosphogluconolactonase
MTIKVFSDFQKLSSAAADLFVDAASDAVATSGRFAVALSGGGSPRQTYRMLGQTPYREKVAWEKVNVFWGDERCVPAGDPRHNATAAFEDLLDHVPVVKNQIHPILCDRSAQAAATEYDSLLRSFFHDRTVSFDLILLGLGGDGHTASLFPHSHVLNERQCWAKEVFVPEQDMFRVTLTPAVINRSAIVLFLVYGNSKSQVMQNVLEGPHNPQLLPAQFIKPSEGKLFWFVDESAASNLTTVHFKH